MSLTSTPDISVNINNSTQVANTSYRGILMVFILKWLTETLSHVKLNLSSYTSLKLGFLRASKTICLRPMIFFKCLLKYYLPRVGSGKIMLLAKTNRSRFIKQIEVNFIVSWLLTSRELLSVLQQTCVSQASKTNTSVSFRSSISEIKCEKWKSWGFFFFFFKKGDHPSCKWGRRLN